MEQYKKVLEEYKRLVYVNKTHVSIYLRNVETVYCWRKTQYDNSLFNINSYIIGTVSHNHFYSNRNILKEGLFSERTETLKELDNVLNQCNVIPELRNITKEYLHNKLIY